MAQNGLDVVRMLQNRSDCFRIAYGGIASRQMVDNNVEQLRLVQNVFATVGVWVRISAKRGHARIL